MSNNPLIRILQLIWLLFVGIFSPKLSQELFNERK